MPTVLRWGAYRAFFYFYSNERGEPPHIQRDLLEGKWHEHFRN